jgi:hypothetical protein
MINFRSKGVYYIYETWEFRGENPIRSNFYILIFVLFEKLLMTLNLDYGLFMYDMFYVIQAMINIFGDYYQYKLGVLLFNKQAA